MTESANPALALPWETRIKQAAFGAWVMIEAMYWTIGHLPLPMPAVAMAFGGVIGVTVVGTLWPAWREWMSG